MVCFSGYSCGLFQRGSATETSVLFLVALLSDMSACALLRSRRDDRSPRKARGASACLQRRDVSLNFCLNQLKKATPHPPPPRIGAVGNLASSLGWPYHQGLYTHVRVSTRVAKVTSGSKCQPVVSSKRENECKIRRPGCLE